MYLLVAKLYNCDIIIKKNMFFEFVNYVTDKLFGLTGNIVDNFTILTQLSNRLTSILIFIWMKIIKILSITMYRDQIQKTNNIKVVTSHDAGHIVIWWTNF